jgi:hypothetical protein
MACAAGGMLTVERPFYFFGAVWKQYRDVNPILLLDSQSFRSAAGTRIGGHYGLRKRKKLVVIS